MPAFNRADTIMRAIRSVQAQTFTDWELIVVDDGSTDNTAARIEGCDPRLKLIRQENQGTAGARNTGLRASSGAYIAFLDSDDEWLPHHLELSVSFLEAFPEGSSSHASSGRTSAVTASLTITVPRSKNTIHLWLAGPALDFSTCRSASGMITCAFINPVIRSANGDERS